MLDVGEDLHPADEGSHASTTPLSGDEAEFEAGPSGRDDASLSDEEGEDDEAFGAGAVGGARAGTSSSGPLAALLAGPDGSARGSTASTWLLLRDARVTAVRAGARATVSVVGDLVELSGARPSSGDDASASVGDIFPVRRRVAPASGVRLTLRYGPPSPKFRRVSAGLVSFTAIAEWGGGDGRSGAAAAPPSSTLPTPTAPARSSLRGFPAMASVWRGEGGSSGLAWGGLRLSFADSESEAHLLRTLGRGGVEARPVGSDDARRWRSALTAAIDEAARPKRDRGGRLSGWVGRLASTPVVGLVATVAATMAVIVWRSGVGGRGITGRARA